MRILARGAGEFCAGRSVGYNECMTRQLDKRAKLHIAITAAWMVFIFVQSALPGDLSGAESNVVVQAIVRLTGADGAALSFFVRKAAHFTEYAVLGGLLAVCVKDFAARRAAVAQGAAAGLAPGFGRFFLPAWGIGALYAVTDEIHQAFVPERACAVMDVGIDAAGVACGVLIVLAVSTGRAIPRV